jgi:4-oxalocrotonate tautomerase
MPEVTIHAAAGRTPAQKKAVMRAVAEAVVTHLGAAPEHVVVQIVEVPRDSKSRGGVPFSDL